MRITYSQTFMRQSRWLGKKHMSLEGDIKALENALLNDPKQGTPLGKDCYKIRLAISSKGKGKSGGARVITCIKILADKIVMLAIYDKAEQENMDKSELEKLLHEEGLD